MADEKTDSPSGAATPKGKLESLSKEDLVKFVKRQTILLQKAKIKNTELEAKIIELEKSGQSHGDNDDIRKRIKALEEDLKEVNQEKEDAVLAYNAVQSSQENSAEQIKNFEEQCRQLQKERDALQEQFIQCEKRNKNMLEECDCLKMKNETLTSTLQCLQQEFSILADSNKLLISEKSTLQIKLEDLEEEALAWKAEKESLLQELSGPSSQNEKLLEMEKEKTTCKTKLEVTSKLNEELQERLDKMESNAEQRKEQIDLLQGEINRLQSVEMENQKLCTKLEDAEKLVEQLRRTSNTSETEKLSVSENVQSLLEEVEALKRREEECKIEFSTMEANYKDSLETLKREKDEILFAGQQLKSNFDSLSLERSELVHRLEGLRGQFEELIKNKEGESSEKLELVLLEKQSLLAIMEKELSEAKLKLTDYEAKLDQECSTDVIETLRKELADAKLRISELESVPGQAHPEQSGWSDLPDIQEESEKESQDEQGHSSTCLPKDEAPDTEDNPEPVFVYTERIEKFIKVSNHVVEGEVPGDTSRIETLKARIIELEKEKTALSLALEQLQIQGQVSAADVSSDLDHKYTEIISRLQEQKQHLEEKLAILGDRQETLTFELVEMQAERESMKSEMDSLQRQLQEWENMMGMLKEEKDSLAQELEESVNRDASLRKELEFLLSSLNEAITERDTLQDEVFKLSQHEDSAQGDVREMKGMIQDIIMERNSLLSELDTVLSAKAEALAALEALRQDKEDIEREKETLLVRLHVGEDLSKSIKEENEGLLGRCSDLEKTVQGLQDKLNHSLDNSNSKMGDCTECEDTQLDNCKENTSIPENQVSSQSQNETSGDPDSETDMMNKSHIIAELQSKQEELDHSQEKLFSAKQNLEDELKGLVSVRIESEELIEKLRGELIQKEDEMRGMEKLLEEMKSKLLDSELAISSLVEEKQEVVRECDVKDIRLQECDILKQQLEAEFGETKELLATCQQEISLLRASQREWQSVTQTKDTELAESAQDKLNMAKSIEDLQQKVLALEAELGNSASLEEVMRSEKQVLLDKVKESEETIRIWQDKSSTLKQELSLFKESTASSEHSTNELLAHLQQSQTELSHLKASLANVTADLDSEKGKADSLEKTLADLRTTHELRSQETQTSLAQITQEKNDLAETLQQQKLQFLELEQTFNGFHQSFQEKVKALEEANAELVSKKEAVEDQLLSKSKELEGTADELSALKKMIESLKLENQMIISNQDSLCGPTEDSEGRSETQASVAAGFAEVLASSELLKQQLVSKIEVLQKEREELDTRLKRSEAAVMELQLKLKTSDEKYVELSGNFESLLVEKKALAGTLKEVNSEKETLETSLKEVNSEKESLATTLKEVNSEKESLASTLKEVISEKESLEATLKEVHSGKESLEATLTEVNSEKESLATTLKEVNSEKETLEISLKEVNSEKESLASTLKEVISEKESLEATLKEVHSEKESLEATLTEVNSEKESLATTLKEVNSEKETLESSLKEVNSEIESLATTLKEVNSEKESLASTLKEVISKKESLEATLKEVNSERDTLVQSLKTSTAELESFQQTRTELGKNANTEGDISEVKLKTQDSEQIRADVLQTSSEVSDKMEALRKELTEKERINNKLKQLAIKSKKELGEKQAELDTVIKELNKCREELEDANTSIHRLSTEVSEGLSQQMRTLQENYKQLQSSFDAVQDDAEKSKLEARQANRDLEQLVGQLAEIKNQMANAKEEKENSVRQAELLRAEMKVKEGTCDELRAKMKASETELCVVRIQLEEINKDKQRLEHKMSDAEALWKSLEEDYKSQLAKLEACVRDLQDQLAAAKQSVKQNSMLDLEMADYERTISTLHSQVEERDRRIGELRSELDKLDQRINLMQTQISASEEQRIQADGRANKLKSLLVKTKKELSDARQQETTQKSSEVNLRSQLEEASQQVEELKVQISDLRVENNRLQEKIKVQGESSQRLVKSLESKVDSLTEELQLSRRELEIIQADYENYKVRAHNVLKQQKAKAPSDTTVEVDKQERARYENAIDQLKGKLQDAHAKLDTAKKDLEQLQNEHDHLSHRHSKLISDLEEKEANFKFRLEDIQKDKNDTLNELMEKITSLEVQKTFLTQKHKEQVFKLKEDHESAIELLQKQMEVSEMDNIRLQREIQGLQRNLRGREEAPGERPSPHDFHPIAAHPVEERQEGEGSEVVDHEPIRLARPNPQPPSYTFEQLITTPMNELPGLKSPPPLIDEEALKNNLSASQKKVEHLTELLSESEASVSMLTEQARILKEEIRRLERNIERERETQNMEYLKNIFLQFVCPKVGEQRQQLVPVLTTMLKLSPEEKARIVAVTQNDDPGGQQGAQGGWGAYLHRWSGLT